MGWLLFSLGCLAGVVVIVVVNAIRPNKVDKLSAELMDELRQLRDKIC